MASIFAGSPAEVAGIPAGSVISKIDGKEIVNLEGFRDQMNTTRPGQIITITAGEGKTYQVNLTSNEAAGKQDGAGFIGIGISGNAVYSGGAIFREAPARQFLQVLKDYSQ